MFTWIIIECEKRCILGIYFVLRMNYFVLVDQMSILSRCDLLVYMDWNVECLTE